MEKDLISAIMNVGRILKEKIHSSKCLSDFSPAEIEVLTFLRKNKNSTMRAVADYLHIKPPSVTSTIDHLAKRRVVKRAYTVEDRREVRLVVTEKGIKLLQAKQEKIHKAIKKIFNPLSKKDKEVLIKIFEKITNDKTK